MADKEIKLIGSFKDEITPKLKKLNTELSSVTRGFEKLQSKLRPIARDMGTIAMASARVADSLKQQRSAFESSTRGMQAYKKELGGVVAAQKQLARRTVLPTVQQPRGGRGGGGGGGVTPRGGGGGITGAAAAGTFLGGGALMAATGAANAIGNSVRGAFSFLGDRFREAVEDEVSDIQAQGAIFGVLRKEGLVKDFKMGEKIARILDVEIGRLVASSPIPTETITMLNRTLSDTFLPGLMKAYRAKGANITDAATQSAQQLAKFYEQIGYIAPPNYPIGMVSKGITKLIESGRITGEIAQIDFFQMSPQLIPELRRRNFEQAKDVMTRMRIFQEAMNTVMPQEAITKMRTSLASGVQGLQDNFLNPTVGIFSFAAQAYGEDGAKVRVLVQKAGGKGLIEVEKTVLTPFDMIGATLGPSLTALADVLSATTQRFGPLTKHLADAFNKFFGPALQTLTRDLDGIAKAIAGGDMKNVGEILGKVVGNILKALSTGLDAIGDAKGPMGEFMKSFTEGLNSVFPKEAQDRLAKRLESAFGTLLSKTVELAAPPLAALLVATVTRFIEGLFNAGLIGKIILGAGALKLLGGGSLRGGLGKVGGGLVQASGMVGGPIAPGRQKGRAAVMARRAARGAGAQTVGAFQQMPGVAKGGAAVKAVAQGAKMKGVGLLAAGAVKMATVSPQLAKVGQSLTMIGKRIPLLNVAFAGLDFATRKASGASTAEAAGGAGGSLAGGIIGGAIGTAILPGIGTAIGGILGSLLGDWIGTNLPAMLAGLPAAFASIGPMLSSAWAGFVSFIQSLPGKLVYAVGYTIGLIEAGWANLVSFVTSLPARLSAAISGLMAWLAGLPSRVQALVSTFVSSSGSWISQIGSALTNVGNSIVNWAKGLPGQVWSMLTGAAAQFQAGREAGRNTRPRYGGSEGYSRGMSLGQAIATEMRYKPPGSDLVIANSSETIIPAYKGYNIEKLVAKSAAEGNNTGRNISMNGITINVNGASGDVRVIADQIAGELLAAMTTASYTELYTS
jgi:hypothetical protein